MAGIAFPARRLVSQEDASLIESPRVPRSKFVGSWSRKTTFDAGRLVPFMVEEVLPGDHLKYDVTAYVRMSTPLFPLFDNQRIDTFFFFVPNRIVWENFEKFMGAQDNPGDSIAYTIPQEVSSVGGFGIGTLADHFGLPTIGQVDPTSTLSVNGLPFRGYFEIWNQWFRDENLQNSVAFSKGDAPSGLAGASLFLRGKSHDYFTTCLPWPQKFTQAAAVGPVTGFGVQIPQTGVFSLVTGALETPAPSNVAGVTSYNFHWLDANAPFVMRTGSTGTPDIQAELSVNTFRQAMMVQALLERDARGGTRYPELIKAHFDATIPDFRVQRPEYIGGGSTPLQITPIAQTATGGGGLGALGAAGTAVGSHTASYASVEHGFIIGLINVRTELSYSQGLHRMWSRRTRYDLYWPALAELGEQAVLRKEIYARGTADDDLVFGYQERWHEYRTRVSEVTGLFRPTSAGSIDQWHLSQEFTSAPVLGNSFIQDAPDMGRVLAAGPSAANMQYLADILIRREAVRPIPMYGTPATLGRF